ncbi:hypothetical protein Pmani_029178 [Petrolisthes manimaculis]|uniref:Uncharacterized protein n=1 Tax=Petrolisthes manimaculis TaxID=1843537 RepID=A0AAE1P0H6_9EUCA|nr:hypothetical protein Pmani_029178 [Petrolisthes manimaculis]
MLKPENSDSSDHSDVPLYSALRSPISDNSVLRICPDEQHKECFSLFQSSALHNLQLKSPILPNAHIVSLDTLSGGPGEASHRSSIDLDVITGVPDID